MSKGNLVVDRLELEIVVVVSELQAGLLAGCTPAIAELSQSPDLVHCRAIFRGQPRQDHVPVSDGPGAIDNAVEVLIETLPRKVRGRSIESKLFE